MTIFIGKDKLDMAEAAAKSAADKIRKAIAEKGEARIIVAIIFFAQSQGLASSRSLLPPPMETNWRIMFEKASAFNGSFKSVADTSTVSVRKFPGTQGTAASPSNRKLCPGWTSWMLISLSPVETAAPTAFPLRKNVISKAGKANAMPEGKVRAQ